MRIKKRSFKKIALGISLAAIFLWAFLGAGTSLAWFTDTSDELNNVFHMAEFDLVVSHRLEDGSYEEIDQTTKVLDDEALYEPGYVQVVYLKVENRGDRPFDFRSAVSVTEYTSGINVYGLTFCLQDYLLFGVVSGDTEAAVEQQVANRDLAELESVLPLSEYTKLNNYYTDVVSLDAKDEMYMAVIVRMPKEVGNAANHMTGTDRPEVKLGMIFEATQQK